MCVCECVLGPFNKVLWNSLQIPPGYHCDSGEWRERARERERESERTDYHSTPAGRTEVTAPSVHTNMWQNATKITTVMMEHCWNCINDKRKRRERKSGREWRVKKEAK